MSYTSVFVAWQSGRHTFLGYERPLCEEASGSSAVADGGPRRRTAEDYEAFITALCAMPPGPERDQCIKCLTAILLQLYSGLGVAPPAGLSAFVDRIGGQP